MDRPAIIGLDPAMSVFRVHGVSSDGAAVLRRHLRRDRVPVFLARLEPFPIGMAVCSFLGRDLHPTSC